MKYTCVNLITEGNKKSFAFLDVERSMFKTFWFSEAWSDISRFKKCFIENAGDCGYTLTNFLDLIPTEFFDNEEQKDTSEKMSLTEKMETLFENYKVDDENDHYTSSYRFFMALWNHLSVKEGKEVISTIKRSFEPTVMYKSETEQTILDRVGGSFSGIVDVIDEGKGIELYEAMMEEYKRIGEEIESNEERLLNSEVSAKLLGDTFKNLFKAIGSDRITYVKDGKVHQACLEGNRVNHTEAKITF